MLDPVSLTELAETQIGLARRAVSGRSAQTVAGGPDNHLHQTVLALTRGTRLGEHEGPAEATLYVLRGRIVLDTSAGGIEGRAGDFLVVPAQRHALVAVEDTIVLLTAVARRDRV